MYTHIYTVIAMRISLQIYANVLRQMPHKSAWKLSCGKTRRIATHQNKTKQNKTKLEQSKTKLWKLILPTITTTTTTSTTTTANVSPRHKTQLFWQASAWAEGWTWWSCSCSLWAWQSWMTSIFGAFNGDAHNNDGAWDGRVGGGYDDVDDMATRDKRKC